MPRTNSTWGSAGASTLASAQVRTYVERLCGGPAPRPPEAGAEQGSRVRRVLRGTGDDVIRIGTGEHVVKDRTAQAGVGLGEKELGYEGFPQPETPVHPHRRSCERSVWRAVRDQMISDVGMLTYLQRRYGNDCCFAMEWDRTRDGRCGSAGWRSDHHRQPS